MKPSETKDLYERLGFNTEDSLESITEEEIVRAYRNSAKQYHPDFHSASNKELYEREFIAITEAYEALKTRHHRARYHSERQYEKFNFHEAHKRYMDFVSMIGEKFPELAGFLRHPDIAREVLLIDNLLGGLFSGEFGFSDFRSDEYGSENRYIPDDKEDR